MVYTVQYSVYGIIRHRTDNTAAHTVSYGCIRHHTAAYGITQHCCRGRGGVPRPIGYLNLGGPELPMLFIFLVPNFREPGPELVHPGPPPPPGCIPGGEGWAGMHPGGGWPRGAPPGSYPDTGGAYVYMVYTV